jgi:Flp pilus assembly protein TadG
MRVRRHGASERRGGATVEMAFVAPLLISLVFGQIEFARLGMVAQMLTVAAREGSRLAVLDTDPDTGNTISAAVVQTKINTFLQPLNLPSSITLTAVSDYASIPTGQAGAWIYPTTWATATLGTPITVVVRVPYAQVSWIPHPRFLESITIEGSAAVNSEHAPSS